MGWVNPSQALRLLKKNAKDLAYANFAHLSAKTKERYHQILDKAMKAVLKRICYWKIQ